MKKEMELLDGSLLKIGEPCIGYNFLGRFLNYDLHSDYATIIDVYGIIVLASKDAVKKATNEQCHELEQEEKRAQEEGWPYLYAGHKFDE